MSKFLCAGDSVVYIGKNGWPGESTNANMIGLKAGRIYKVKDSHTTDMRSNIILEQFPNYIFNAVMFERSEITNNIEAAAKELCRLRGIDPMAMERYSDGSGRAVAMSRPAWKSMVEEIHNLAQVIDLINKYEL